MVVRRGRRALPCLLTSFRPDPSGRFNRLGSKGVNGVKSLAEKFLPFGRVADFAGFGRVGNEVNRFDKFFVKIKKLIRAALLLVNAIGNDRSDAFQADGAAF